MRKHFILFGLLLIQFIVAMDVTILNTTAPVVVEELGGMYLYGWVFAIYTLISTVLVPIFGKVSDRFGRKKIFLISIIVFLLFSLMCGLASSMEQLIIYRALKGVGAGGINALTIVIASDLLGVEKRAKFQGHLSVVWGIAAFSAPVIGSLIVEYFHWKWIFFVNVPFGVVALLAVVSYKEEVKLTSQKVAWLSAFYFAIAAFILLWITTDWTSIYIALPLAIVFIFLFITKEKNASHPFLSMSILKNPILLFFQLNTFLFFFALFGLESFIPYFLQKEQGVSVLLSGLVLAGISIGWVSSSYFVGRYIKKNGYKRVILTGNFILFFSSIPFIFYKEETSIWLTFIILFFHGFSYGLIQNTAVIGSYEISNSEEKGFVTSLQSFSRHIGTSFSMGLMGSLLFIDSFYVLYVSFGLTSLFFILSLLYCKKYIPNFS